MFRCSTLSSGLSVPSTRLTAALTTSSVPFIERDTSIKITRSLCTWAAAATYHGLWREIHAWCMRTSVPMPLYPKWIRSRAESQKLRFYTESTKCTWMLPCRGLTEVASLFVTCCWVLGKGFIRQAHVLPLDWQVSFVSIFPHYVL